MNLIKIVNQSYFIFSGQNIICYWAYNSIEDIINQLIKRNNSKSNIELVLNSNSKILILDEFKIVNDKDNSELIAYKCFYENKIFWSLNHHFQDLKI